MEKALALKKEKIPKSDVQTVGQKIIINLVTN